MNVFTPPLKVHLCWFDSPIDDLRDSSRNTSRDTSRDTVSDNASGDSPFKQSACKQVAIELFELLHRPTADDFVLRPGLEIPCEFGRDLADLLGSLERGAESDARVRVVVSLLDAVAHDNAAHRQVVRRACDRWRVPHNHAVHIPILLDPRWADTPELSQLDPSLVLGSELAAHRERTWALGSVVAVIAARALRSRLNVPHPPNPTVFFSHDADGGSIARALESHFARETTIAVAPRTPEGDGAELTAAIAAAGGDAVFVVIRTDRYAEDNRSQLELLVAKQTCTPILTIMAASDGELRAPAYGGNHRSVNWRPGREWEVTGRLVQAWLHAHHFEAHARAAMTRAGLPAYSQVIARRPELLDLFAAGTNPQSQLLIHPDPPLTTAEVDLLRRARPAARFATPSTLLGRVLLAHDPLPPLAGTTIGLSLSVAEDMPTVEQGRVGTGLTHHHVNDTITTLVLATLHSGARIAYGGDLRLDGYAKMLSDLHRSRRRLGTGTSSQLLCFVDATTQTRPGDAADDIEFERETVPTPAGFAQFEQPNSLLSSLLWHLAVRHQMAQRCHAQVLLGGKMRPSLEQSDGGYSGAWPGFLEEALRTLERGAALYLVGGFGGAAGIMARMLQTGALPKELTRASLKHPSLEARASALRSARSALLAGGVDPSLLLVEGGIPLDTEDMAERVLARWRQFSAAPEAPDKSAWDNGLTVSENLRLFRSTDPTEITHLVFEGIRRLKAHGDPQIAVYHGDIASVPDVGAYAVTITPGMPPVGASRAIDTKAGRVIAAHTWSDHETVAVLPLGSADLVGRHAIVLRLPLGSPDTRVSADAVKELAELAADEADKLGIASVALVPFGTTLGLPLAESVRAIEAGFRASGNLKKTLVFCESDRARYQELLSVFHGCTELRAGPRPAPTSAGAVLQVAVDAPTPEEPYGRLRSTLYAASNLGPVIPRHEDKLTLPVWRALRNPFADFDATSQLGRLLWSLALSEPMREQLATAGDQRLVVIGDPTASSIPWEILTSPAEQSPARAAGLVRRIELSGHVAALAPEPGLGARLRVLIVVNPGDLVSVDPERREIEAALTGYADIFIKVVENATLDHLKQELRTGHFDVLHYAGHASFDESNPDKTGLHLMDGVFSGEDLKDITSPRLVFLSACESGRLRAVEGRTPKPGEENALAEAFLRQGVKALLGTFFAVQDGAARAFAANVYRSLASGATLGTAVQQARCERFHAGDRDWANFLLYGNDSLVL